MSQDNFNYYFDNYIKDISLFRIRNRSSIDEVDYTLMENVYEQSSQEIDKNLEKFYSGISYWKQRWKTSSNAPVQFEGSINIVKLEDVLNWKAWDLMPNEFPQMENFTILDYFYNEAAVGFYLGAPEKGLYYFEFDADPKPLNLDFKGYLEMIKYTKGASYWQLGCIEPIVRTTNKAIEKLNQIDPSITVEGFYKLYDSVRINK